MDNLKIAQFEYDIRRNLGWTEVYITLQVNNHVLPDILNFQEFTLAVQQSGRYPLFVCTCGNFGCGGSYLNVDCTDHAWILRNRYSPTEKDEILELFQYRIAWTELESVYLELVSRIRKLQTDAPDSPIHWGVVGSAIDSMPTSSEIETALATLAAHADA